MIILLMAPVSGGTSITVPLQHRLGLRQRLLQRERPTGGSDRLGSVAERFPGTSMGPLVVVTGRQGERRGLGL